jgi:stress-induced morphogen
MTPKERDKMAAALSKAFAAEVGTERVGRPGRYRFTVVSEKFAKMAQLARQDAIWKIVDETLSREASMDVSLILAYAPKDLEIAK